MKVLLVEDDPFIADIYLKTFHGRGIQTLHTDNGFHALKICESEHPEIILLDVMVRGMTGLDVLHELRLKERYGCQHAVIALLSNISEDQVEDAAREYDVDAYILKVAISPDELADLVEEFAATRLRQSGAREN